LFMERSLRLPAAFAIRLLESNRIKAWRSSADGERHVKLMDR
jgi:hypothetical protein